MERGKCEATGKLQYATRREARLALNKLMARRDGKTERGAYNCRFCGAWHLTSQRSGYLHTTRLEPATRWRWDGGIPED